MYVQNASAGVQSKPATATSGRPTDLTSASASARTGIPEIHVFRYDVLAVSQVVG